MRIGFITACDISRSNGYRTRVLSELEQLTRQHVAVSVISFLHVKHYKNGKEIRRYVEHVKDLGCPISVVPVLPDNQSPLLYRILDAWQSRFIRGGLKQARITLLHCHATQAAYLGTLAARSTNVPVIYDMHGSTFAEQNEIFAVGTPVMNRVERVERVAVHASNAVIAVSESLQRYWKKAYPQACPFSTVIPCAVDTEKFKFFPEDRERLRSFWNVDKDAPLLVYLGSATFYQKIDKALEVFSSLRSHFPGAHMLVITPQNDVAIIRRMAADLDLADGRLHFCSVAHAEVPKYLSACDFGFLLRDDLPLNNVSSPTKFGEYLACGVPVIASAYIDDARRAIETHRVGSVFSGNLGGLEQFIEAVMSKRNEWRDRCRSFASDHYSWQVFGAKLANIYGELEQAQKAKERW